MSESVNLNKVISSLYTIGDETKKFIASSFNSTPPSMFEKQRKVLEEQGFNSIQLEQIRSIVKSVIEEKCSLHGTYEDKHRLNGDECHHGNEYFDCQSCWPHK